MIVPVELMRFRGGIAIAPRFARLDDPDGVALHREPDAGSRAPARGRPPRRASPARTTCGPPVPSSSEQRSVTSAPGPLHRGDAGREHVARREPAHRLDGHEHVLRADRERDSLSGRRSGERDADRGPRASSMRVTPASGSWAATRPASRFSRPASASRDTAGTASSSLGRPSACTAPSCSRTSRSATASASPTLWVTYRQGTCQSSRMRTRYGRTRCRRASVERGQRLVEQQQARPRGQRPGQGHALTLASGERRRVAIQQVADLEGVDRALGRRVVADAEADVAQDGRDAGTARRPAARSRRDAGSAAGRARRPSPASALRSSAIRPRAARRRPAMDSSSDVLPEPDGPMSAVTPRPSVRSTRSGEARQRQLDARFDHGSAVRARRRADPLRQPERREGQDDRHPGQDQRAVVPPDLAVVEDGEGEGPRLAGDVPGDHHRRPELAQRPREGQDRPRQHAAPGQGKGHPEERGRRHRSRACGRCRPGADRPPRRPCAPSARAAGTT